MLRDPLSCDTWCVFPFVSPGPEFLRALHRAPKQFLARDSVAGEQRIPRQAKYVPLKDRRSETSHPVQAARPPCPKDARYSLDLRRKWHGTDSHHRKRSRCCRHSCNTGSHCESTNTTDADRHFLRVFRRSGSAVLRPFPQLPPRLCTVCE